MFAFEKSAADDASKQACRQIMQRIYSEEPSYWPHGCDLDLFANSGDSVFMVRKASTGEPVGFTGWQERWDKGVKVGYYAIGILPEYRRNGHAKAAISELLRKNAANVDCVRAFVMPHNQPSLELARSLDVPVVKVASRMAKAMPWLKGLGYAAAGALPAWAGDKYYYSKHYGDDAAARGVSGVLNSGIGVGMLHAALSKNPSLFSTLTLGVPLKEVSVNLWADYPKLKNQLGGGSAPAALPSTGGGGWSGKEKAGLIAALGLGGLGVTAGAMGIARALSAASQKRDGGRIQVRLPTRNPKDQETMLDVPVGDAALPPTLQGRLMRDVRRKLRQETKERTWARGEDHKLLTHRGGGETDMEDDLLKDAAMLCKLAAMSSGASGASSMKSPVQPIKSLQFQSSLGGGTGSPFGGDPQNPEQAMQQQEQQKQVETMQKDLDGSDQKLRQAEQDQIANHAEVQKRDVQIAAMEERMKTMQQAGKQVSAPDPYLKALQTQTKQLTTRAKGVLSKLASVDVTFALRVLRTIKQAKYEPYTPDAGNSGEGAHYRGIHGPGSMGRAFTDFAFNDGQSNVDNAYNAFAPTKKPGDDWTLGDTFKQWGANAAGTGAKAWNFITSPFRYVGRQAARASSRLGDFGAQAHQAGYNPLNIPTKAYGELAGGLWDTTKAIGAGYLGARGLGMAASPLLSRVGLSRLAGGASSNLGRLGMAAGLGGMLMEPGDGSSSTPSPVAESGGSALPAEVAARASNPMDTVNAFGHTGAANLLQQGGHMMPPEMRGESPFYQQATNYKTPLVGHGMRLAGDMLGGRPSPNLSFQNFADISPGMDLAAPAGGAGGMSNRISQLLGLL